MQTDKITVTSLGIGMDEALDVTNKFAAYAGLDKKQSLRIRLLVEETLGMVSAITGDFGAQFWLENTPDCLCRLHLEARTIMDADKRDELVRVATSRKNEAYKGFMGKIRELMENSRYGLDEMGRLQAEYGGDYLMYSNMGMVDLETASMGSALYTWSLERYKSSIGNEDSSDAAEEAWDELEKSIVASIADDVRVSVYGDKVELIIEKRSF